MTDAIALTKELSLTSIHAFTFRLQELRRDPKERQGQALKDYFFAQVETDESSKAWVEDALMLN